jgi:DNA mismatch endonuclease (patch repair protein)
VAVFCDGDFWHGRDWESRRARLERGTNGKYWIAKIQRNRLRDWEQTRQLLDSGWTVVRLWESEIKTDCPRLAKAIWQLVRGLAVSVASRFDTQATLA